MGRKDTDLRLRLGRTVRLSGVMFVFALAMGIAEATGHIHVTHPYFWFAIASGTFGVFGSALIRSRKS